jgi:ferrous iron transport protein B
VGNYSGVTVDAKMAQFVQDEYQFNIVDLPGTYSITHYTPEELYVRNYIFEQTPDVVINVIDSSNLERNLFLTTQLIDMDIKVVIALNMFDELQKRGDQFDYESLGKMIGIPIVPTIGTSGKGLKQLFETVIDVYHDNHPYIRHIHINYGKELEHSISEIQKLIKQPKNFHLTDLISSRFLSIKLLENDNLSLSRIETLHNSTEIIDTTKNEQYRLEKGINDEMETIIADARYAFIAGALKETLRPGRSKKWENVNIIDTFLLNKVFAFPVFSWFYVVDVLCDFLCRTISDGMDRNVSCIYRRSDKCCHVGWNVKRSINRWNYWWCWWCYCISAQYPYFISFYQLDGRYRIYGPSGFYYG